MSTRKIFAGYWAGYSSGGNVLNATPGYVNTVTLFVAGPAKDRRSLSVNYLCSAYSQQDQIAWVRELQQRGTEVLMALMDTPDTHWDKVDIPAFVQNVKEVAIDGVWGLNGVDIDLESGMSPAVWSEKFTELIREFRRVLGPKGTVNDQGRPVSRITVDAYRPELEERILKDAGADLDWLNTMKYWNDAQQNEEMFHWYSRYVPVVNLGVSVGKEGDSTPLDQVSLTAQFAARTENCGMMEFALNYDCPAISGKADWTWASTINEHLNLRVVDEPSQVQLPSIQIAGEPSSVG